jgi:transposase-like protein
MAGHGEKLTRKQEQAIAALLSTSTVSDAARRVGVSESTLGRWLQRPEFVTLYRQHRRQLLDHSLVGLQKATGDAVETLVRNLTCGTPAVEVRAAVALLDLSWKGTELLDLEARVAELEGAP